MTFVGYRRPIFFCECQWCLILILFQILIHLNDDAVTQITNPKILLQIKFPARIDFSVNSQLRNYVQKVSVQIFQK